MKHYLFTYGMLTNTGIMDAGAIDLGAALLRDWQFEMLTFANVHPKVGAETEGVLWEIDDAILESCDWREGYPNLYDRVEVQVEVMAPGMPEQSRQHPVTCWVYTLTPQGRQSYLRSRASDHYVSCVAEGYRQHGVDLDQLRGCEIIA